MQFLAALPRLRAALSFAFGHLYIFFSYPSTPQLWLVDVSPPHGRAFPCTIRTSPVFAAEHTNVIGQPQALEVWEEAKARPCLSAWDGLCIENVVVAFIPPSSALRLFFCTECRRVCSPFIAQQVVINLPW